MNNIAFQTNTMARGLNESKIKTPLDEAKGISSVKDGKGDTWKRRDGLVRNASHPNHYKPIKSVNSSPGIDAVNTVRAWHNQRNGEIHEGGVRVHSDGSASIGDSYDSNPRFFHISHYEQMKAAIKEETDEKKSDDKVTEGWAEQPHKREGTHLTSINMDPKTGKPASAGDYGKQAVARALFKSRTLYRGGKNNPGYLARKSYGNGPKVGSVGADIYKYTRQKWPKR